MRRTGGKASRQAHDELTALLESVRVELAATRADGSATVAMLRRELRAREGERAALLDAVVRLAGSMAALAPGAATANGAHSPSGVIGGSVMPDQSKITVARDDDFLEQDEDEIVLDEASSSAVAATIEAAVGLTGAIDGTTTESGSTVRAMVAVEAPPNGVATNGVSPNGVSPNGVSPNGVATSEASTDSALGDTVGVAPDSSSRQSGHGAVEVRCRFGDKWVDGFEICEIVRNGGRVRYRLRRLLDGCVLPELFNAADVRCFDAPLKDS